MASNIKQYYAVAVGRQTGIFNTWKECEKQVKGIQNARYRKFNTIEEANEYIKDFSSPIKCSPSRPTWSSTPPSTPIETPAMKNVINHFRNVNHGAPLHRNKYQWRCHSMGKRNSLSDEERPQRSSVQWNRDYSGYRFNQKYGCTIMYTCSANILGINKSEPLNSKDFKNMEFIPLQCDLNTYQSPPNLCESPFYNFKHLTFLRNKRLNNSLDVKPIVSTEDCTEIYNGPENAIIHETIENNSMSLGRNDPVESSSICHSPSELLPFELNNSRTSIEGGDNINIDCTRESYSEQEFCSNISNESISSRGDLTLMIDGIFKESLQNVLNKVLNISLEHLSKTNFEIMQKLTDKFSMKTDKSTNIQSQEEDLKTTEASSCNCSSKHKQEDIAIAAVNLRLDAIEKRFDDSLIQMGSIMSEIQSLKDGIKNVTDLVQQHLSYHNQLPTQSSSRTNNPDLAVPGPSHIDPLLNFNEDSSSDVHGNTKKRKKKRERASSTASKDSTDNPSRKRTEFYQDKEEKKINFMTDTDSYVNVYTDGACENNGSINAKAGVGVWFGPDHPLNVSAPVVGPATNNTAEIQAARIAVELAVQSGITKLQINTDSEFLINCMTKWIHKWKSNGWRLVNKQPVKNKDELEKLSTVLSNITVRWNKVLAHHGVYGNEEADRLAVEGAKKYKTQSG